MVTQEQWICRGGMHSFTPQFIQSTKDFSFKSTFYGTLQTPFFICLVLSAFRSYKNKILTYLANVMIVLKLRNHFNNSLPLFYLKQK